MYWLIIVMRIFTSTFPSILSRLIGRYLDGYLLFSFSFTACGTRYSVLEAASRNAVAGRRV